MVRDVFTVTIPIMMGCNMVPDSLGRRKEVCAGLCQGFSQLMDLSTLRHFSGSETYWAFHTPLLPVDEALHLYPSVPIIRGAVCNPLCKPVTTLRVLLTGEIPWELIISPVVRGHRVMSRKKNQKIWCKIDRTSNRQLLVTECSMGKWDWKWASILHSVAAK